jgi:hypothetical protein
MLQKSATSTTCNNDYRMELRCSYEAADVLVSQAITVQMCNLLCKTQGGQFESCISSSEDRNSEAMYLDCSVDSLTVV